MNVEDFLSDGPVRSYDEELADVIDGLVVNDSWRTNREQCYYVTNVVERTLDRLPRGSHEVRETRSEVQGEVADETNICKQGVQAHCHVRLFKGYECPPRSYGTESEWFELFDQLIREVDRKWYRNQDD